MAILTIMRPHQWLKNLLLLVPLFTSQQVLEFQLLNSAFLGFIGFSLVCSSNYICNDLIDLEVDRQLEYKAGRPLASGRLSTRIAGIEAAFLFVAGIFLCFYISGLFAVLTLAYMTLGLTYSRFLKKFQHLNIIILVLFYEIRIIAGGALLSVPISFWLIIFSYTVFSSLAFLKKYSKKQIEKRKHSPLGEPKQTDQEESFLHLFGIGFASVSLLTFSLYLNSEQVSLLYQNPKLLWILVPLLQFLFFRIWRAAMDGEMHYDPILFILKDLQCAACLTFMVVMVLAVSRLH
jgi:4-hydroxybenzoate polyprenyltransferase